MKKIICAAIALFGISIFSEAVAEPYWPDNIRVEDTLYPSGPTIGRHEIVDANVDRNNGKVDINFAEAVDEVTVSIVDEMTGAVVSEVVCDTDAEPSTSLDAPVYEGSYKLHIKGKTYEGVGYFNM